MSEPTAKDIKDIETFFGSPVNIPGEFARWMSDQFALAVPSIPISQLFGARTIERMIDFTDAALSVTGSSEVTIYETILAGKSIAQNGRLKVSIPMTLQDASTSASATIRVKLNGSTVHSHPCRAFYTTPDPLEFRCFIWNQDVYTRQVIEGRFMYQKHWDFATVDMEQPTTLTITFQFTGGDANDIFVRKAVIATLYNPSE